MNLYKTKDKWQKEAPMREPPKLRKKRRDPVGEGAEDQELPTDTGVVPMGDPKVDDKKTSEKI